ncbi:hypothetical protein ATCC90586_005262 [Pythium insidiosum]|nr:hypothetical protein ATCC90586_005262 [Pythium insidiosum]
MTTRTKQGSGDTTWSKISRNDVEQEPATGYMFLRKHLHNDPELIDGLKRYSVVFYAQTFLTVAYPAYTYVFERLESKSQVAFAFVLPFLKLFAKNLFSYASRHIEDLKPELVVFNVEVFSALYVSSFLHASEFIALVEYVEVSIPMVYSLFTLMAFHLPNRAFYIIFDGIDVQELHNMQWNLVVYVLLELLSLILLDVVLRLALQYALVHYGADFSFRFDQLTSLLGFAEAKLREQLLIASEKGKRHAVYLLLHQGIDRQRCRGMRGFTPVHHAAARGHLDVLQLLLNFGWPVDVRNDLGESPLHLASYGGHVPATEFLLDRGANANALTCDGETPLFYASRKHQYRVVRMLIRRECDLSIKNRFGDLAEDEALDEKTRLEFSIGREDRNRLYAEATEATRERALTQKHRELVLAFLDLRSLCRVSQVCYRWHRATDCPALWRRLGVSRWELSLQMTVGLGAVSPMSLDVFLRIAGERDDEMPSVSRGVFAASELAAVAPAKLGSEVIEPPTAWQQYRALLTKRLRIARRDRRSLVHALGVPLLFLLVLLLLPEIQVASFLPDYASSLPSPSQQAACPAERFAAAQLLMDQENRTECAEWHSYCGVGLIACEASACCDPTDYRSPWYACANCPQGSAPCGNPVCMPPTAAKLQVSLNAFIIAMITTLAMAFVPAALIAYVVKEHEPTQDAKTLHVSDTSLEHIFNAMASE